MYNTKDHSFAGLKLRGEKKVKIRGGENRLIRDPGNHLPSFMPFREAFIEMKMILHLRASPFIQETAPHYKPLFFSPPQTPDLIKTTCYGIVIWATHRDMMRQ